jgi:hypothetical protein
MRREQRFDTRDERARMAAAPARAAAEVGFRAMPRAGGAKYC